MQVPKALILGGIKTISVCPLRICQTNWFLECSQSKFKITSNTLTITIIPKFVFASFYGNFTPIFFHSKFSSHNKFQSHIWSSDMISYTHSMSALVTLCLLMSCFSLLLAVDNQVTWFLNHSPSRVLIVVLHCSRTHPNQHAVFGVAAYPSTEERRGL